MLLSALATLGSLAGTAIAGIGSSQANNNARNELTRNHNETMSVLQSNLWGDYTNRADVQSAMSKAMDVADRQTQSIAGQSAVAGLAPNAVALQQKNVAEMAGKLGQNIASQSASYKDAQQSAILQENANYASTMAKLEQERANNIANAGSQLGKSLSSIASGDNNTFGDDLAMFGLDTSKYERIGGHLYRKQGQ